MPTAPPRLDTYRTLVDSWQRALRAAGKAPGTVRIYRAGLDSLAQAIVEVGLPAAPDALTREHIETWLDALRDGHREATRRLYFIAVRSWFAWLVDEGEITRNPCARITAPQPGEPLTPVLADAQLKALLKTCEGREFPERRDYAIVRLLIDTGLRRSELAGIRLADVDWQADTIAVLGKGARSRVVHVGVKTGLALDRYHRARERHPYAESKMLWLGRVGPLTAGTIYHRIRQRAEAAGLGHVWTHMLRHTFSHRFLAKGGTEGGLMRLAGWRRRDQLDRYGAVLAQERALDEHRRLAPGDDL